jgi:hypothetical protein
MAFPYQTIGDMMSVESGRTLDLTQPSELSAAVKFAALGWLVVAEDTECSRRRII